MTARSVFAKAAIKHPLGQLSATEINVSLCYNIVSNIHVGTTWLCSVWINGPVQF